MWVLANPRAGRGRGEVTAGAVAATLRAAGYETTSTFEHPATADAPAERPDAVVVVGGDGTLRAGVERLISLYGQDAPPVLPVAMGTANLMGQYLGLPRSVLDIGVEGVKSVAQGPAMRVLDRPGRPWQRVRRLVRRLLPDDDTLAERTAAGVLSALRRGQTTPLDLAQANGRLFLLMAGVGFDAHVVHALDQRRSGPIGLTSYALPAASAVAGYGFPPVRVEVDGRWLFGPRPGIVMVANVPHYGTGFPIVPAARPDDGLLDVVCLPASSRPELAKLFALAAVGGHLSAPGVARAAGRSVRVTADAPVPVQVDGDPGGTLPLQIEMLDARVRLIRPA